MCVCAPVCLRARVCGVLERASAYFSSDGDRGGLDLKPAGLALSHAGHLFKGTSLFYLSFLIFLFFSVDQVSPVCFFAIFFVDIFEAGPQAGSAGRG